jgi:hypothetical protein
LTLHVLARLLAAGTVALILSAAPAAVAQVEGCVSDPVSCLPATDPDPCVSDPASCLPPVPDPDPCLQDPASCLPAAPDADACLQDPEGCLLGLVTGDETQGELQSTNEEPARPRDPRDEDVSRTPVGSGVRNERPPGGDQSGRSGRRLEDVDTAPPPPGDAILAVSRPPDAGGALGGTIGGLAQAVQDFVFPLLLIAGVSVFLGIQSRIDRKDPKFTLAPIDSRHDVVEFR